MPTATEFELLAHQFDDLAAEAGELMILPQRLFDEGVLVGGQFTRDVAEALAQCQHDAAVGKVELLAAAAECRRRAAVCRAYDQAMASWGTAMRIAEHQRSEWSVRAHHHQRDPLTHPSPGPPPGEPPRPERPAPWVNT